MEQATEIINSYNCALIVYQVLAWLAITFKG